MSDQALEALSARADLKPYGNNALLLFALEIALGIEDIHTVAANALTDGPDDKKCDLLFVDRDLGRVVMAQCYVAANSRKKEAPANKAGDLNTAAAWLFGGDGTSLPEHLKAAWAELDSALKDGSINTVEVWYCHNLKESRNVAKELARVPVSVDSLLKRYYPQAGVEAVSAVEVGRGTLEEWYQSRRVPILLTQEFEVAVDGEFETSGDQWRAVTTSVPVRWLHALFKDHGRKLFSANVRDYLGSRKSDRNINYNIKETARREPGRFWAYNNGVTALVNDYSVVELPGKGSKLHLTGIAIVNGAQTTGAVGSLEIGEIGDARVLARFVKTAEREVVEEIIRYNNTQNKIDPADFRSNDPVQERLRGEFGKLPDCRYLGFRRGSEDDKIRRPQNLISSHTAAQALAAVHQEPNLAYNEKSRIWESDAVYGRFYSDALSAGHLLFCFSLLRAVEEEKREVAATPEQDRTESLRSQSSFFSQRGATFLLTAAISACLEIYLGRPLPTPSVLRFLDKMRPGEAIEAWRPLIRAALPFVGHLMAAAQTGVKNTATIKQNIDTFRSLVEATKGANASAYRLFSRLVAPTSGGKIKLTHRGARRGR